MTTLLQFVHRRRTEIEAQIRDLHREFEDLGADKGSIVEAIREKRGVSVALNSIAAELSRMKSMGALDRHGTVWRLA